MFKTKNILFNVSPNITHPPQKQKNVIQYTYRQGFSQIDDVIRWDNFESRPSKLPFTINALLGLLAIVSSCSKLASLSENPIENT